MRIGLFLPCYIDQMYPQVGWATVQVLERLGMTVDFPQAQTCCGQPLFNSGAFQDTRPVAEHFVKVFGDYEAVVSPSGSCISMVRNHYGHVLKENPAYSHLKTRCFELCEFLVDTLKVEQQEDVFSHTFSHSVGVLQSCHGLRELKTGKPSELMVQRKSNLHLLLSKISGVKVVTPKRQDECCGFGGTFSVLEEAVSCAMGNDRIHEFEAAGADVITGADMSCLMHLQGLITRQRNSLRVLHIAEVLAGEVS